mgnify:CR=1 FL=1
MGDAVVDGDERVYDAAVVGARKRACVNDVVDA